MRPLQVYLDERDLKSLDAWARERGWTKSQAIRAAVRALARRPAEDPLLAPLHGRLGYTMPRPPGATGRTASATTCGRRRREGPTDAAGRSDPGIAAVRGLLEEREEASGVAGLGS